MNPSLPSLAAAVAAAAGLVSAQNPPVYAGSSVGDSVGKTVAWVGDVDGDGVDDYALGVEDEDNPNLNPPTDVGAAYVFSGATGAQIHRWTGDYVGDYFGCSVDGAGDVDGDGVPDIIVGARGEDDFNVPLLDVGAAFVFSGATGAQLYRFDIDTATGKANESRFGFQVAGVGDVDADGYADVAVSGYTADPNGLNEAGVVVVHSGRDGSRLHVFSSDQPRSYAGFRVRGAGDTDRDGFDDVIISEVGYPYNGVPLSGRVRVFSGRDGSVLHEEGQGQAGVIFGAAVNGVGDVDRDGYDDFAIGSVFDASFAGTVRVISGQTGNELARFTGMRAPFDFFGFDVSGIGDWDGDNHPDIAVGAILSGLSAPFAGGVRVYSVAAGSEITSFGGVAASDGFGFSVDLSGDVDADGVADLLIGAPFEDVGGVADSGAVRIYRGPSIPNRARNVPFGVACPTGDGGLPIISVRNRLVIGDPVGLELLLRGASPGAQWTLNLAAPQNPPLSLDGLGMTGCTIYTTIDGFVLQGTTDPVTGLTRQTLPPVPLNIALKGQSLYAQYIVQDTATNPANPMAYVASNAVRMILGN